jgi:hypothetical protein
MQVTLPPELVEALDLRARERQVNIKDVLREAVTWYLALDASLADELQTWQEMRDEALELVDKDGPRSTATSSGQTSFSSEQ